MYQTGDISRTQVIIFENITIEHIVSYTTVLYAWTKTSNFTINNITLRDITNNH